MAEGDVRQYFVRNEQGTLWGPLALPAIERLIGDGVIQGRLQVSEDGIHFAVPGRFPHLRNAFPREMWGDVASPGPNTPAAPPTAGPRAATRPPVPGAGVPVASPGAATRPPVPGAGVPVASPGAATRPPAAGPGVRPAAPPPGAMPPGAPAGAARPGAPGAPSQPAQAPGSQDAPPASGQLETHSPVRLYGLLAAGNHTGLLTLSLAGCTVSIHFRKGNPEFIDSSHPEDSLGAWLLQAKLVTSEQLQQAESTRGRFGGELLAALFGLGLLQPASAFTQLAHRAQAILLKGLRAESGSFTFEPRDLPAAKAMPLGNKWAVLSELVRRIPSEDLRRRLQPVLNLPVMRATGRVPTGDLRLTPHEVRVLALIDGVRSSGQLLNDLPQDADHLLRLVFLLWELDGVSFAAVPQRAAPPPSSSAQASAPGPQPTAAARPATPPAAAPQAARPGTAPGIAQAGAIPVAKPAAPQAPAARPAAPQAPRPAAPAAARPAAPASAPAASSTETLAELRELAAKMKEQNHFERLGLGADTNGPTVKLAYFKAAKQHHPDTLPPGAPPEMEKLKADIFAYIGEAYRILSDDKARAAYIEQLKSGASAEPQVDVEAILKSEELFRKAGHFLKARKFADAVKLLDEAIQLNGEEPEYYAWRGYARFFTFEDKKAGFNEAYRDLQLCLKKNDKVASAHYFLGVIAKLCGDHSGALKHFQKTVELQPNHIDAQREIRMATQKK